MLTEGLWLVLTTVVLAAATAGCGKSVEVIGLGPLDNDAQPEPSTQLPTANDDASPLVPAPAAAGESDVEGQAPPLPLRDASSPIDAALPSDASTPTGQDARADAASPPPLGPFDTPVLLDAFAGADDASFTADGLEMYMDVNDSDQIHVATRASRDEPWGDSTPVDVGDDNRGKTPWITPDGLALYFAAERAGGPGGSDIWWIRRPDRVSPWGDPQPLSNLNSSSEEFGPSVSPDHLQLVLTRASLGLGGQELWLAQRDSVEAPWEAPTLLSVSDPDKKDSDAVFGADGLELWWVHAVTDDNHDLYFARRAALNLPFETPTPATELNSSAHEGDPWLSPDGREIVFFSTRSGERLLYRATR